MYTCFDLLPRQNRSFFSKSPAPSKPEGSGPPHTNGNANGDGVKESLADSPILRSKSKRKRVIIDSDDEDEGGVVCKGDRNGSVADVKNGTNGTSIPLPSTPTSVSENNAASIATPASAARNNTTPSITPATPAGSSTDGLNPKTPPRRKTGEWQRQDS